MILKDLVLKAIFCLFVLRATMLDGTATSIKPTKVLSTLPSVVTDGNGCVSIPDGAASDNTTQLPTSSCNSDANTTVKTSFLGVDATAAKVTTQAAIISSIMPRRGRTSSKSFPNDCGRTTVTFQRIVGGQESSLGAWPWMAIVYLIRRGKKSAECGGALITEGHVLTAAHCIVTSRRGNTLNPSQIVVRLGEHDQNSDDDGASPIDMTVRSIIRHENFNVKNFQNDVAILVLSSTIQFNQNIAPICLPFNNFRNDALEERNAMTAGWGTISFDGPPSPKLMEVQLRIWRNAECKNIFLKDVPITNVNLCAGDGTKDACTGDSGGPLMLTDDDGKFYLIGIVSFGKKCGEPGVPGVYARISSLIDWIEQKVE